MNEAVELVRADPSGEREAPTAVEAFRTLAGRGEVATHADARIVHLSEALELGSPEIRFRLRAALLDDSARSAADMEHRAVCYIQLMRIVDTSISLSELERMAHRGFGDLVKAVVDVERGIMAVDAELHADQEAVLLEDGSEQTDLWGINLYPELSGPDFVEFDSMINIRPSQGNRSRGVDDPAAREKIRMIVASLVGVNSP